MFYKLKCWLWRRYTTIKPRYLDHTWCDRCDLLPEMMFEILSQFIEKECNQNYIRWYGEYGHKIKGKYVMDELLDLYNWWHNYYKKEYPQLCNELWNKASVYEPDTIWEDIPGTDLFEYQPKWSDESKKAHYTDILNELSELENKTKEDLNKMLHRLVDIIPYLWT